MDTEQWIERDLKHTWHPCTQMKDHEHFPPLMINKAYGPYIELDNGKRVIDAISSWWCKSLGHGEPRLKQALQKQLDSFEHVMLGNTTHETIIKLGEKLAELAPGLDKVFYASDGACALEIAMKMSLHAHHLQGQPRKSNFIALSNSYHGETIATLSVSDLGCYRTPYKPLLFDTQFIQDIPYVNHRTDPLWHDCGDIWDNIEKQLEPLAERTTAIVVEPIVQAAGGMRIYSQDFLRRLRRWTQQHNVHLIADEIMTGIGRTGLPLACQHAQITPDFVCLGKGLTSGWLPMSAVLTSAEIFNLFYDDYEQGKSFLHSHTHSGNALAASVALACLNIMDDDNIYQRVRQMETTLLTMMEEIADSTKQLTNIRSIGGIVAADLKVKPANQRLGFALSQKAIEYGALLRPLDNTLYWTPPLNTSDDVLQELQHATEQAICSIT